MATQPKPQPVDNTITVRITTNANGDPILVADIPNPMHVGQTVVFLTDDGDLTVRFRQGSPFDNDELKAGEVRQLVRGGVFPADCRIGSLHYPGGGVLDVQPH